MHLSPMTTLQASEMTRKIVTISRSENKENFPPGQRRWLGSSNRRALAGSVLGYTCIPGGLDGSFPMELWAQSAHLSSRSQFPRGHVWNKEQETASRGYSSLCLASLETSHFSSPTCLQTTGEFLPGFWFVAEMKWSQQPNATGRRGL